jgi:hypothetical protein
MKKSRSAEEVVQSCPPDVQALADKARRLLLKLLPGAEETVDPTASVLSYGYKVLKGRRAGLTIIH